MPRVMFVNQKGNSEFEISTDSLIPVPGDIIVNPAGKTFRVLQRAIVMEQKSFKMLSNESNLNITVQCAIVPVGQEPVEHPGGMLQ